MHPSVIVAFNVIPRGGWAIVIFVGCMFSAVIAAIVAMEINRNAVVWAAAAFVCALLVLSAIVDVVS
jgi:hydroxyethylthiazole kinase-like sugar kinase family protein